MMAEKSNGARLGGSRDEELTTTSTLTTIRNTDSQANGIPISDTEVSHESDMHKEQRQSLPSDPAEEDWFAWLQVLGAFCLNLNTWGLLNSYGAFHSYYQLELLKSYAPYTISWIGSTQAFLLFMVSIFAGQIFDLGHLRNLLCGGSALIVAGMFLLSASSQYYQIFLTQAILVGSGYGCLYLLGPAVISQYFRKRTALAMGVSSIGAAVGGVIYPTTFSKLRELTDFGWATRILGFIVLIVSLPPILVMRYKSPPKQKRSLIDPTSFQDLPYLLMNLGLFLGFMGVYIVYYYIELLALARIDVSESVAQYLLVIINASTLIGRIVPAYYADKIGCINVQIMVLILCGITTFCLLAIRTFVGLVVFSVIYGFASGAFMGLSAAGIISVTDDKSKIVSRFGLTLGTVGIGLLISNPIAGAILADNHDWVGLISWSGGLVFASTLTLMACRIIKIGPGLTKVL